MADTYQMVMELIDEVTPGIDKMKEKLIDLLNTAGPVGKGMAASLGAVTIAAGAASAAMELISKAAKEGVATLAEMGDQANRLGLSIQEYQIFVNTMGQLGVKTDRAVDSLTDMQERIGEARQGSGEMLAVLNQLKIPLQGANGEWRSTNSVIDELLNRLVSIEDSSTRIRLAAQAGGDATRDLVGNIAQAPELWNRAKTNAYQNVLITEDMVKAAREARVELENYNQVMQASSLVNDASMIPLMKAWQNVKTEVSMAAQSAAQFFGIMADNSPAQNIAKVAAQLQIAKDDLASLSKDGKSEEAKGFFPYAFNSAKKNVDELTAKLAKLKAEYELANPKPAEKPVTNQQSDAQIKAQKKALDDAEKARKDAQAKALSDFAEQANAENKITNDKLKADAEETIKTNFITGEAKIALMKDVDATIAANNIATANKIKDHQDKLDETAADKAKSQSTAVQRIVDSITDQTNTINAQTNALQTNNKELEYQVLLEQKIAQAKAANGGKDLDNLTMTKLQNSVKELQLANEKKLAAEQKKGFDDSITAIKDQTESYSAITQVQKNQLEIKQAILDKEREYKRALTDTEKQTLTNALIDQQKAKATADLAQKNADEIKQIYANAAESIQGAFSDFFFDVMQGNLSNLADSFKKTIDRMVADLLAANLFKMVGGIGTGTAGEANLSGFFASIFGGISGRATGGPVTAGTPYWVGEEGPEIVIPSASSTVVPTDLSMAMASGSQGGSGGQQITNVTIKALDAKSVVQLIEDNDRAIVTKLAEASQRYGM